MARFAALIAIISIACMQVGAAATCQGVARMIVPCIAYLTDHSWTPYGPCCGAIAALNRTTNTWAEQVGVCNCLKAVAVRIPHIDPARATILPQACGVDLNITLSPFFDCNSIPPY